MTLTILDTVFQRKLPPPQHDIERLFGAPAALQVARDSGSEFAFRRARTGSTIASSTTLNVIPVKSPQVTALHDCWTSHRTVSQFALSNSELPNHYPNTPVSAIAGAKTRPGF